MIQLIDTTNLPPDISRTEREYLDYLQRENDDPSQRHRIPILVQVDGSYRPAFLHEPTDQVFRMILSELAPIWQRAQVMPFCTCPEIYQQVQRAIHTIESAVTCFSFTTQSLKTLKPKISQTVWKQLKDLKDRIFFSVQDAADTILLETTLTKSQINEYGHVITQAIHETGLDESYRQQRLTQLHDSLQQFHGNIPTKPYPPESDLCPFCHLPYQYSFWELLPYEQTALDRIRAALFGEYPIAISSVPSAFAALELWLFNTDVDLFAKKKTLTGQLLIGLKQSYQELMRKLSTPSFDSDETMPASPASVSSSSDATLPPPPPPILDAN